MMVWFGFMVFNATFNNISVILWRSAAVLLLVETIDLPQVTDTLLSHNVLSRTSHERGQTHNVSGDRH